MSKRKKPKKQDLDMNLLSKINKNATGIDIGADRHWVSVPVNRDEENTAILILKGEEDKVLLFL